MEYFTFVGSFDGAVKIGRSWVRVVELNRIWKKGWKRRQGSPTEAILTATREQPSQQAVDLFPNLIRFPKS